MNFLLNLGDVKLALRAHIFGHEERFTDRFDSKDGSEAPSHCWPAQWRRLAKSGVRIYVMRKSLECRDLADFVKLYQEPILMTDVCPFSHTDRRYWVWLSDKFVPSLAPSIDDGIGSVTLTE